MKKLIAITFFLPVLFIFVQSIPAQAQQTDAGFRGQSLNGATGLFTIPSGRVGWDKPSSVALDFGYRAIINNDMGVAHIPAVTMSLFGWIEISNAFDIQPNVGYGRNDDLLLGFKIKLPANVGTAIALGGNIQLINIDNSNGYNKYSAYQPYIAVTFPGNFFVVPAETTIVIGKTFYSDSRKNNSNIDFGMGFDVVLFPKNLRNLIHAIVDFSNFSYSDNAWLNSGPYMTDSVWRGLLNAGFRFDLSTIPELNKFKFLVDIVLNDVLDAGSRSFTAGIVFGLSVN